MKKKWRKKKKEENDFYKSFEENAKKKISFSNRLVQCTIKLAAAGSAMRGHL